MNEKLIERVIDNRTIENKDEMINIGLVLDEASNEYYNKSGKIMSDTKFDILKTIYMEHGGVIEGAKPPKGTVSVEHKFKNIVGSLSKVNNIEELRELVKSRMNEMDENLNNSVRIETSYKYDGNSVAMEFEDGKLVKALTRGRHGKGKDVTHVFKNMTIEDKRNVGVQTEIIMTWENLDEVNRITGNEYVSPRSVIGGVLGSDDNTDIYPYLDVVPLSIEIEGEDINRDQQLQFIHENFRSVCMYTIIDNITIYNGTIDGIIDNVEEMYNKLSTNRLDLDYMIDGIVVRFYDKKYESLGIVSTKPKFATALKFPYMEAESTVNDFDFTIGPTSRITPRVWFDKVKFNGATQEKVSLANYDRFKELGLGIGSKVLVQYRNDTLSYVEDLNVPENDNIEPYEFTKICPACGEESVEINDNRTFAFCNNELCPNKVVGRLERYLTKLDVKGVKESTLSKLFNAGLIEDIKSLYTLDYTKVSHIDGLGERSADLIKEAIEYKNKDLYDFEVLAGLGIEGFGRTSSKLLTEVYDLDFIIENYDTMGDEFVKIEGFADITYDKFNKYMNLYIDELKWLKDNLPIKSYKEFVNSFDEVYTLCFTGFRDKTIQEDMESKGHTIKKGMSKKVDILVAKNPNGSSKKITTANKYEKEVISIDEFKSRFGYN